MQEKKLLRDALEAIRIEVNCALFAPDEYNLLGTLELIGRLARRARMATTEETEMEKLVVWKLPEKSRSYFSAVKRKGCVVRFEERPDLFLELTCYGSLIDELPRDGQLVEVSVRKVEGTKE